MGEMKRLVEKFPEGFEGWQKAQASNGLTDQL